MTELEACTSLLLRLDADMEDSGPLRLGGPTLTGSPQLVAVSDHPLGLSQALSFPGTAALTTAEWPHLMVGGEVPQELELWVKVRTLPSSWRVLMSVDVLELWVGAGGALSIQTFSSGGTSNSTNTAMGVLAAGEWHHLRFSIVPNPGDASRALRTLYLDGKAIAADFTSMSGGIRPVGVVRPKMGGSIQGTANANADCLIAQAVYRRLAQPAGAGFSAPTAAHSNGQPGDVLLAHFDGGVADSSPAGRTITLVGATTSAAGGRFGGALSTGESKYAKCASTPDLAFGSSDWTIQAWVYPRSINSIEYPGLLGKRSSNSSGITFGLFIWGLTGTLNMEASKNGSGGTDYASIAGPRVPVGAWSHIVAQRSGNTLQLFVNGEASAPVAITGAMYAGSEDLTIGRLAAGLDGNYFDGLIDDLRITVGAALYANNPPAPSSTPLPPINPPTLKVPAAGQLLRKVALPATALKRLATPLLLGDYWRGGKGRIADVVVEDVDTTSYDPPLRRRVLLIREDTGECVRQTWSDAATGAYEFRDLDTRTKYTVLALDHAGNYRAAIASGLTPTAMF